MSGVSMSILDIDQDELPNCFSEEKFIVESQTTLDQHGAEMPGLGNTTTKVVKEAENDQLLTYEIDMSSETKEEPIYIHDEGIERWESGYQSINQFKMWVLKDQNRLFVFAPKKEVSTFMKRLRRAKLLDCTPIHYDFSRITELENLDSAWGLWQDSQGVVQRIGKFGKGIDEEIDEGEYDQITTLYIDYNYGSDVVQLILSEGGSISTKQSIDRQDIFAIYEELLEVIIESQ